MSQEVEWGPLLQPWSLHRAVHMLWLFEKDSLNSKSFNITREKKIISLNEMHGNNLNNKCLDYALTLSPCKAKKTGFTYHNKFL